MAASGSYGGLTTVHQSPDLYRVWCHLCRDRLPHLPPRLRGASGLLHRLWGRGRPAAGAVHARHDHQDGQPEGEERVKHNQVMRASCVVMRGPMPLTGEICLCESMPDYRADVAELYLAAC